jgi:hypothetical protein
VNACDIFSILSIAYIDHFWPLARSWLENRTERIFCLVK